jgi:hypothetical protein
MPSKKGQTEAVLRVWKTKLVRKPVRNDGRVYLWALSIGTKGGEAYNTVMAGSEKLRHRAATPKSHFREEVGWKVLSSYRGYVAYSNIWTSME